MNDKYDTVKPGEEETKFQFYDHNTNGTLKLSELQVDSEYVILHNHKGKQLFFDDVRGMLSVDEKLRHSTSRSKKSALVGKIVSKSGEEIKINIIAKRSIPTEFNRYDYLKVDSSCTKHCEFSMARNITGNPSELSEKEKMAHTDAHTFLVKVPSV